MAAGAASIFDTAPQFSPHAIEIVVWYPFGVEQQTLDIVRAEVARLLEQPNLGPVNVETPGEDDDSTRAASTEYVQRESRKILEFAAQAVRDDIAGIAQQAAAIALTNLFSQPGALEALMQKVAPQVPGVIWDNGGSVSISQGS